MYNFLTITTLFSTIFIYLFLYLNIKSEIYKDDYSIITALLPVFNDAAELNLAKMPEYLLLPKYFMYICMYILTNRPSQKVAYLVILLAVVSTVINIIKNMRLCENRLYFSKYVGIIFSYFPVITYFVVQIKSKKKTKVISTMLVLLLFITAVPTNLVYAKENCDHTNTETYLLENVPEFDEVVSVAACIKCKDCGKVVEEFTMVEISKHGYSTYEKDGKTYCSKCHNEVTNENKNRLEIVTYPELAEEPEKVTFMQYLGQTTTQILVGDLAKNHNPAGTVGEIAFAFTGLDAYKDVLEFGNAAKNKDILGMTLSGVSFIPVVGSISKAVPNKAVKEVAEESVEKISKKVAKEVISSVAKYGDDFGKMGKYIESPNIKVDWQKITKHGTERMAERNITKEIVEETLKNGKVLDEGSGKFAYITKEAVVIINEEGVLITTWGKNNFNSSTKKVVERLYGGN